MQVDKAMVLEAAQVYENEVAWIRHELEAHLREARRLEQVLINMGELKHQFKPLYFN